MATPQTPQPQDPKKTEAQLKQEGEQRKQREESSRKEAQAAASGAQAVADAVQKVAQAAVAAAQGAPRKEEGPSDFIVSGSPGGRFRLEGPSGIFKAGGTVSFGNRQVQTQGWSAEKIYGTLPSDVPTNVEVTVDLGDGVEKKGFFRG